MKNKKGVPVTPARVTFGGLAKSLRVSEQQIRTVLQKGNLSPAERQKMIEAAGGRKQFATLEARCWQ